MAITHLVFDIGGVLEVGEVIDQGGYPDWLRSVAESRGLDRDGARERLQRAGRGVITEAALREGYRREFELDEDEADAFLAHFWDWYCGELNTELLAYAEELSADYAVAICSNSFDG